MLLAAVADQGDAFAEQRVRAGWQCRGFAAAVLQLHKSSSACRGSAATQAAPCLRAAAQWLPRRAGGRPQLHMEGRAGWDSAACCLNGCCRPWLLLAHCACPHDPLAACNRHILQPTAHAAAVCAAGGQPAGLAAHQPCGAAG